MQQKDLSLIKSSDVYTLKITSELEQKIRLACASCENQEWSGVLFYTYAGSFENNDLVLTCVDMYVLDIGTATYTEWEMSPEVIAYMTEYDLLDCQLGIIHSHNSFNTFFSDTDKETLSTEGFKRNNLLSLIVNNAGEYSAVITKSVFMTAEITAECKYNQFDNPNPVVFNKQYSSSKNYIEYSELNIEYDNNSDLHKFAKHMSELHNISAQKVTTFSTYSKINSTNYDYKLDVNDKFTFIKLEEKTSKLIKTICGKLITGNLFFEYSVTQDDDFLQNYIDNQMAYMYSSIFKTEDNLYQHLEYILDYLYNYYINTVEVDNTNEEYNLMLSAMADYLSSFTANTYLITIIDFLKL